jgi:DNA replication protein DnaC
VTTAEDLRDLVAERNETYMSRRPRKYRAAIADHPGVLGWIDSYVAALPPASSTRRITERPHANSLFLYGGPGSGKTHQALGIPAKLAEMGVPANFTYMRSVDYFDDQQNAPFELKTELFEKARDSRLLILDDLFAGGDHKRSASDLYRLLDARFADERPTVLVSNLDGQPLKDALGPRLSDRLREDAVTVKMDTRSRREFRPVIPE